MQGKKKKGGCKKGATGQEASLPKCGVNSYPNVAMVAIALPSISARLTPPCLLIGDFRNPSIPVGPDGGKVLPGKKSGLRVISGAGIKIARAPSKVSCTILERAHICGRG